MRPERYDLRDPRKRRHGNSVASVSAAALHFTEENNVVPLLFHVYAIIFDAWDGALKLRQLMIMRCKHCAAFQRAGNVFQYRPGRC